MYINEDKSRRCRLKRFSSTMASYNTRTVTQVTTVKVYHDGDIRRFTIPAGDVFPSFSSLLETFADLFQLTKEPRLFYTDFDGDRITMVSERDLIEALTMLQEGVTNDRAKPVLRLEIVKQLASNQVTCKRSHADNAVAKIQSLATSQSCDTNEHLDIIHDEVDGDGQVMATIMEAKTKHRVHTKTQCREKKAKDIRPRVGSWMLSYA